MKEKNKVKSHPFAGHLHPTEEVLWMSFQAEPSFGQQDRYLSVFMGTIPIAGVILYGFLSLRPQGKDLLILVGTLLLALACFFIPILGYMFLKRRVRGTQPPELIYAVTNERLLYRSKKGVVNIPLEAVPSISVFLGTGARGTFNFGAFFPMWPDVEDAVTVKSLIDKAQKERLKELKA